MHAVPDLLIPAAAAEVWQPLDHPAVLALGAAVLLGALLASLTVSRMLDQRRRRGLALWWRLRLRLYPGKGYAKRLELWLHYGLPAARKIARYARPTLKGWWLRRTVRHSEIATRIGWAQGWLLRMPVYATLEDQIYAISPQKEGKTPWLACRIADAPGPVVATSIRTDLVELSAGLAARRGTVHLFNPEGLGDLASTVRWSPVDGCAEQATAIRRSAHMVAATRTSGLADQDFWEDQAAMSLAALLHAAALAGLTLAEVYGWVLTEDPTPLKILSRPHPGLDTRGAAAIVRRYQSLHVRTRDSIFLTLRQTLRCMEDPAVAWTICPPTGQGLDVPAFLRRSDTLYLIAEDGAYTAAPVIFAALVAEIHHQVRLLGSRQAGGRLDPPLRLVLDEAPTICPIALLPQWLATSVGHGMEFLIAGQSTSQFKQRWGIEGSRTIWNNCKTKILWGATSDPEDLETISKACGEIGLHYWEESVDASGNRQRTRRFETVPVLPPEQARMLPTWHAVVIRRNVRPTIVRVERIHKRADYKRWKAAGADTSLPQRHDEARPVLQRGRTSHAQVDQLPPPAADRQP